MNDNIDKLIFLLMSIYGEFYVALKIINWFREASEYDIGISMIFGIPILLLWILGLVGTCFLVSCVFTIRTIREIISRNKEPD